MKIIFVRCAVAVLNIINSLIRAFSRRKPGRITLISSQADTPSRDIKMLADELRAEGLEVVVLAGRMRRSFGGALKFAGSLLRELRCIAVSEVVILESYTISACAVKHGAGVTIIQMWHAPDALKKFSRQILDTPAGSSSALANALGMHRNYDYLLCPSPAVAPAFTEAFDIAEEKLVFLGLPRIDYLAAMKSSEAGKAAREAISATYPRACERPLIVYAPTFRDGRPVDTDSLIKDFDFSRFTLVIKLHPLYPQEISGKADIDALVIDTKFSTDEWLTLAGAVITDYSGIAVEAAVCGLPLYFYVYDIDRYAKERGLNFDLRKEAISPYVFTDAKSLCRAIDPAGYDLELLKVYRERMLSCPLSGNTKLLADFVKKLIEEK